MKKARLPDGQVLLAHQYKKDEHGAELLCADPDCNAHMGFRREALTHGSLALKSAHFFSKSVKEHITDCNAHEELAIQAKHRKSLEQAIREGKNIVINLNVRLMENFNGVAGALVCQSSTNDVRDYAAVGARNIEDMLDYIETITEKGGDAARAKTRVNYQGKTLPLEDFIIDSKDKFRTLLNSMYLTMQSTPRQIKQNGPDNLHSVQEITDFPRLIRFSATEGSREGRTKALRGTPINIFKKPGQRIVLLQRADTDDKFRQTLRGEVVHLIARPSLHWHEAQRARRELDENNPVVFLDMHWKVVSATQFTPDEKPAPKNAPDKPKQGSLGI
ncbi:MAG: hypothetical protein H3C49_09720 [Alphaproteobacteria bacterium]|nr:hypothetical protein [Alphaproteobacteria bacterium]